MVTTRWVSAGRRLREAFVLAALVWPTFLQAQPDIDHPGIECIAPGKYAVILSGIDPELEVVTAKVYFRSSLYPDFYYVEMTYEDGRFQGVLPKPAPETTEIIYYLEAVDTVFNGTRTIEWDPEVQDCDDEPAAAYFTGDEAGIVVGATTSGQSALPPGFSAAGIIGTIASTGIASGIGGGVGAGTAVAVGATAAGAAGAVVVAGGPTEETTTSAVPTSATTTAVAAPDPGPSPTSTTPRSTTSIVQTTTTTVQGGTTTTAGSTTTTTIATTTVATTTVSLPPLDASCFSVEQAGECKVRLSASCVEPSPDRCDWILDVGDRWERSTRSNDCSSFVHDFGDDCEEDDEFLEFRLTVHRGPQSDTETKSIVVRGNDDLKASGREGQRGRFDTELALPPFDGSATGRVVVNDSDTLSVDSSAPVGVVYRAAGETNRVTAVVSRGSGEPGRWRFDFRADPAFEPGSIRVTRGHVLSIDSTGVVLDLRGHPGERVELSFERRR